MSTKEILANRLRDLRSQLIAGHRDPKEAMAILDEMDEIRTMLKVSREAVKGEYSSCRQPIDAVVQYLKNRREPSTKDEIVRSVVEGGFGGGGREQETAVRRSIGVFLNGTGARTKVIRERNDLIGLGDWEDERFDL